MADLSAGLSYSVMKNCLNKVLRISDYSELGESVVVQGGTFRNISVFRSLELLSSVKVSSSDNPELMGAYGAGLHAMDKAAAEEPGSGFVGVENLAEAVNFTTQSINCAGCTNKCQVSAYKFPNGRVCYSGNKCEKIFTNNAERQKRGENIFEYKRWLIFNRPVKPGGLRIGIPRVLDIYENYPFWHALLTGCGFEPVLSGESSHELYQKGLGALLSDNICFPAKLAHGHVADLAEKGVDRILLPMVVYEKKEFSDSSNSFNCPIVTGYGEVLRSTLANAGRGPVQFDTPTVNFDDLKLLKKNLPQVLRRPRRQPLGVFPGVRSGIARAGGIQRIDRATQPRNTGEVRGRVQACRAGGVAPIPYRQHDTPAGLADIGRFRGGRGQRGNSA